MGVGKALEVARATGSAVVLTLFGPNVLVHGQGDLVGDGPQVTRASEYLPPSFFVDSTVGAVPHTVNFTSNATWKVTKWDWDFGDGSRSKAPNPSYSYTAPGVYDVTLTALGASQELTTTRVGYITVTEALPTTVVMVDGTLDAGLTETFTDGNSHTGGSAWIDVNGDYWPDLFITNGAGLDHYLYINNGDGTFTDRSTRIAKPMLTMEDAGVKFGDLDNDGDSDILVFVDSPAPVVVGGDNPESGGSNLLYLNQGNVTFAEIGASSGLFDPEGRRSICGALADFDRDGFLDVYVGEWAIDQSGIQNNYDRLLRNTGAGGFTDVTALYGTTGYGLDALTCGWFDANRDGWPDLYVGTVDNVHADIPLNRDALYMNGLGSSFTDVWVPLSAVGDDAPAAMGWDVGDIDADGDWDLYITDMYQPGPKPLGNPLYLGDGSGGFSDNIADVAGVQAAPSWPCNFADFDRDGWVDLWVGTLGATYNDLIYLNNRDGTFTYQNVPQLTGNETRGGSISDFDGDGDVDIFLQNFKMDSVLMRNESTDSGGWIELKLFGQVSNRDAIGAHIDLVSDGLPQMRRVSGGDSAHSQMDLIVHFGVAEAKAVDLSITWPSGIVQEFKDVPTGGIVFIDELAGLLPETFSATSASFDSRSNELTVSARSSFGGRTKLRVPGYGSLDYEVDQLAFSNTFLEVSEPPATVRLESRSGASRTLPVSVIDSVAASR